MVTILEKRYNNILMDTNVSKLHQYFNIQNAEIRLTDMNTLEINFSRVLNSEVIQLIRTKRINRLNSDVIDIIVSYIPNRLFLKMNIHVEYPPLYPFRPPKWSINEVSTNIIHMGVCTTPENYCRYIVNIHNNQYEDNWTPAIQMIADILNLFLRFNHFDILTKCYE